MPESDFPFNNAPSLVRQALTLDYFHPNGRGEVPIPARFQEGTGSLVLALGENASGKSFFRRIIRQLCKMSGVENIHLSMEGRGDSFGGLKSFVYGDEEYRSTGENSAGTIIMTIRTSRGRDNKHVIFWDEPDFGLSDMWAAGAGVEVREFSLAPPPNLVAAILVTHSRAFVRELLPANPPVLWFGEGEQQTLQGWLDRSTTPRPLSELAEESRIRWKLIQEILCQKGKAQ
jgi:hypothetical protein